MPAKSTPERDALIAQLLEKMRRQLQEPLPDEAATLDQIEEVAGKIGRQVSQDLQRRLVQQRSKQAKPSKIDCLCGEQARYKGKQARSIVTAHGLLTYKRACYYCPTCQQTLAPLDTMLGVDRGSTSTQVRLWVGLLAGHLPFAHAATTLHLLTGVALSAASVERLSVSIGTRLRTHQHAQAKQHQANRLPEPVGTRPKRLYIGLDGVFVPLREAWKKDQSQGELTCRYGECKSGVVYETYQDKQAKWCIRQVARTFADSDVTAKCRPLHPTRYDKNVTGFTG